MKPDENQRKCEQALVEFQSELDRRIASLDRGEGIDGEKFFKDLKERTKAAQRKSV